MTKGQQRNKNLTRTPAADKAADQSFTIELEREDDGRWIGRSVFLRDILRQIARFRLVPLQSTFGLVVRTLLERCPPSAELAS